MLSLAEIYPRYAGVDCPHGCDKGSTHDYLAVYEALLAPYRATAQRVLEIGIMGGHSLRMWEEYFTVAEVWGVDLCEQPHGGLADLRPMIAENTHHIALFNAADAALVEQQFAGYIFDVIVEDAGHQLHEQITIYNNFKRHLSPNGIYFIEDVEDIDRDHAALDAIDSARRVRVFDRRAAKGRFDDVLVVIGGER